jgi:hypothetical protein
MSDSRRTSGSADYNPSSYHDQFIKPDPKRTSGSSSLQSTLEPPPIPPPDYTPISKEEWAKSKKPPLKGIIAEPEWRPSQEEAKKVLGYDKEDANPSIQSTQYAESESQSQRLQSSLYRSSGTSDILGRAAEAPDGKSHNLMPGGTRHSAGGETFHSHNDPTFGDAVTNVVTNPVAASKSLLLMPSFRIAILTGIASGFVVGGALWSVGKRVPKAANGAVTTFFVTNIVAFLWCERKREHERKQSRLVQQVWEESRLKKAGEWEKLKAERERRIKEGGLKPTIDSNSKPSTSWAWRPRNGSNGREG